MPKVVLSLRRVSGSFLIRNVSLWFFVFIDLNFIGSPSGAGFSRREWGGTFISRVWIFLFCSWERASLGSTVWIHRTTASAHQHALLSSQMSQGLIFHEYITLQTHGFIYSTVIYVCAPLQKTITVPNKSETNRQNESGTTHSVSLFDERECPG